MPNTTTIVHANSRNSIKKDETLLAVKKAIINVLKNGPMCLSELSITIGKPIDLILKALHEMSGSVEERKHSFPGNNSDFQMWGIARPRLPRILKKKSKKT